jgi:hypothetical protein
LRILELPAIATIMAATNKCLAQINKTRTGREATKRRETKTIQRVDSSGLGGTKQVAFWEGSLGNVFKCSYRKGTLQRVVNG